MCSGRVSDPDQYGRGIYSMSLELYDVNNSGIESRQGQGRGRNTRCGASVGSTSSSAIAQIPLQPFQPRAGDSPMVISCKFSRCGNYLAVARNDDRVHIYDPRFLKEHGAPILAYRHSPLPNRDFRSDPSKSWGITAMYWVEGLWEGFGLVTGGGDGTSYPCSPI